MPKIRNNNQSLIGSLKLCHHDGTFTNNGAKKGSEIIDCTEYIQTVLDPDDDHIELVELARKVKRCKTLTQAINLCKNSQVNIPRKKLNNAKKVKDAYDAVKWESPHVYPSCIFDKEGCRIKNVVSATGLLVYDLQNVDDKIYRKITEWEHTVILHQSIGGGNNYALFLYCPGVTVDNHTSIWEKGERLIIDTFKINPESSDETKDVTRIRYLSYDPDIYYNEYAEPVFVSDIVISTHFTPEQKKKIDKYLDTEPKWFKFLMALAVAKGEAGREFAHTFSRENAEKYSAEKLNRKYDQCLDAIKNDKREKGITRGTLFWQLKKMGVPYCSPKAGSPSITANVY